MITNKTTRHQSRILAIQILFIFLSRDQKISIDEIFNYVKSENKINVDFIFTKKLIDTAIENIKKIKIIIKAFSTESSYEKISLINQVILILGISEMKFIKTPFIVVINEYIDIAKKYGEAKSGSFINGVLDSFRKNLK